MYLQEFGLRLAKLRIAKNISAYELSLRIDKSTNYINRVENGGVNIPLTVLIEICNALDIKPGDLF